MYGIGYFQNLGISVGICCWILWELSMIADIFKSRLIVYIFQVSWLFTLLKSAHNKKLFEYGRSWFVCQDFGLFQDFGVLQEGQEIHRVSYNYLDWAKYQNRHSSKSICQNSPLMGQSFWQKNSFISHILFELCLFWYLAQSR